jgi:hypothetical protein
MSQSLLRTDSFRKSCISLKSVVSFDTTKSTLFSTFSMLARSKARRSVSDLFSRLSSFRYIMSNRKMHTFVSMFSTSTFFFARVIRIWNGRIFPYVTKGLPIAGPMPRSPSPE